MRRNLNRFFGNKQRETRQVIEGNKSRWLKPLRTTLLAFAIAISGSTAFAHSEMNKSVPKDGETVAAGLSQIELKFTNDLRLTLAKISREVGKGAEEIAITRIPKAFTSHVTLSVPSLQAGDYEVTWTGVGKDGHVMSGSFTFTVSAE